MSMNATNDGVRRPVGRPRKNPVESTKVPTTNVDIPRLTVGRPRKTVATENILSVVPGMGKVPENINELLDNNFDDEELGEICESRKQDEISVEKQILKTLVSAIYQVQKLRIAYGNKIFAAAIKSVGVTPGTSPYKQIQSDDQDILAEDRYVMEKENYEIENIEAMEEKKEKSKSVIVTICEEYKKITTHIAQLILTETELENLKSLHLDIVDVANVKQLRFERELNKLFNRDYSNLELSYINNSILYAMARQYIQLLNVENNIEKQILAILQKFPIYTKYLVHVKGCGPRMSGCIIANIDINIAYYVSKLWSYVGIDVADDGRGRGLFKEHMVERSYTSKDGTIKTKMSASFNVDLRVRLLGVLSGCLLKLNPQYKKLYDDYKHRIMSDPERMSKVRFVEGKTVPEYSKARIHSMAMRRMLKFFLQDLWVHWRLLEGLPLPTPYQDEKLGIESHFRTFDTTKQTKNGKMPFVEISWRDRFNPDYLCYRLACDSVNK